MAKPIVPLFSPIKDVFPIETLLQDYQADLETVGEALLESPAWEAFIIDGWLRELPKAKSHDQLLLKLTGLAAMSFIAGARSQQLFDKQGRC